MTFEIELKIKLFGNDRERIDKYLSSSEFTGEFLGGFEQTDYYFDTVPPSFAEKDTALRIRIEEPSHSTNEKQNSIEITYKGKKIFPNSKTRLEYNLDLVPETEFKSVEGFFNELGFVNAINIKKTRFNYCLEPGIVLSLDTNELGDFVEIEKIIEDEALIEETESYLWNFLQKIIGSQLSENRRIVKSYLELILESKNNE